MHRIIEQIRQAKIEQGITHAELAHVSGVGLNTIKRWFHSNGTLPKMADLEAVANVLGYDIQLIKVAK